MADANANLGATIASIVPSEKLLANRIDLLTRETNELITSGLAVNAERLTGALMQGGPRKGGMSYVNALDTDVVNVTTDTDVDGLTGRITADEFNVVRHDLNFGWKYFDLTSMITQFYVRGGIEAGISDYWNAQTKKLGVATIKGAAAAAGTSLSIGSTTVDFSRDVLIDAAATAEEYADEFDLLLVSPTLKAKLQKDRTNFTQGETGIRMDSYGDKRLITTTAFGNDTAILARTGTLALTIGTVPYEAPVEVQRDAGKGTGGGREILWSRRSMVCHPQGFNFKGAVGQAPSAMANAANWEMELAPKFIGFRVIKFKA